MVLVRSSDHTWTEMNAKKNAAIQKTPRYRPAVSYQLCDAFQRPETKITIHDAATRNPQVVVVRRSTQWPEGVPGVMRNVCQGHADPGAWPLLWNRVWYSKRRAPDVN